MSGRWADDDVEGFRRLLSQGIRATAAIVIPAALGYLVLARPIVRLLLEHGPVTTPQSGDLVADVLVAFAIGLFPFSAFQLLLRAFYAMQDTRTPALVNLAAVAINVVADLVLFFGLDLGVQGLALGHAISYGFGSIALLLLIRRRLRGIDGATGARDRRPDAARRRRDRRHGVARGPLARHDRRDRHPHRAIAPGVHRDRRGTGRVRRRVDGHADRRDRRRSQASRREVAAMRVRTDERGLIGKILLLWLVILGLVVVALIDGGSIVLARLRTNDLARDVAFAAEERFSETGRRRQAVGAALATIAETDEDARLVELEVSGRGDVTVVVSDRAGTLLVGRFGFFEDLTTATASDTAS